MVRKKLEFFYECSLVALSFFGAVMGLAIIIVNAFSNSMGNGPIFDTPVILIGLFGGLGLLSLSIYFFVRLIRKPLDFEL